MNKKSIIILLLLHLVVLFGNAQDKKNISKSNYPRIKPELILDGRSTLVSNSGAKLGGVRAGIEVNRVNRFGFGFYSLSNNVPTNSLSEISSNIVLAKLGMSYSSIYYERVLLFTKKYEWSSTIHLGSGRVSGSYLFTDGTTGTYDEPFQLSEISTTVYKHLTYFISIGGGIGYRQTREAPAELMPIYNAPIFIVKLRVQPFKAIRGIWSKEIRNRY